MHVGDHSGDPVLPDQLTSGQSGKELIGLLVATLAFAAIVASFFIESGW
ncbi:MAG TPA: hypothetical protein VKZ49_07845 [Polyangiaceae bacterium]|nr:hypothetical protein [Polyangiaceae bacterium]